MNDHDRIDLLRDRLTQLQRTPGSECERAVLQVGRLAIESELAELGQRLAQHRYWIDPAPRPSGVVRVAC